ncbi:hypothetical protein [Haloferula sp.]|uniref:hypothetical protein n=1 Tax=Haloferula sp. TaxID=2497595 RepID=UPI003C755E73
MLRWFAGLLAVFCSIAVARVEWLDFQAGGVIRRKLETESGMRWSIAKAMGPADQVGVALMTWGVALHGVAVLLVFVALFRQARDGPWRVGWAVFATLGMVFLCWVFYRQYFAALGW